MTERVRFDRLISAPQSEVYGFVDFKISGNGRLPQQIRRDDQALVNRLAMLAESCGDIHRVAEKGELALGVAAFADDHRPGVQAGAKARGDAEFALVGGRKQR